MSLIHNADGLAVYNADLLDALPALAPGSIDAVVTSPPYAMQRASTYGGVPEKDYPDWTVAWMNALKPALAERGSVMLNISPHTLGGMLSDYVMRTRLALRADGWYEHMELVWTKPDKMPTGNNNWPVHSWESILWYSQTRQPWSTARRNGNVISEKRRETASRDAAAFRGRDARLGWDHLSSGSGKMGNERSRCKNFVNLAVRNIRNEWDHPAPFSEKLADWIMKINTPDGGTVLDPFAGSGTTAVAALRNGFQSVAIEREPEYAQMIVDRYRHELAQRTTLQAARDKGFRSIGIEADADHVALIRERLEQGSGEPDLFTCGSDG